MTTTPGETHHAGGEEAEPAEIGGDGSAPAAPAAPRASPAGAAEHAALEEPGTRLAGAAETLVAAPYMPASMLRKADVHIQVDGAIFPAHSTVLEIACGVLRDAPDFANSTPAAPAVLSAPFSSFPRDEVEAFLRVLYATIVSEAPAAPAAARRGAVHVARALDAKGVLAHAEDIGMSLLEWSLLQDAPAAAAH